MKKAISAICMVLLLLLCGGCSTKSDNSEPPWLPADKDYLRMPTAMWDALVADGEISESEIMFPIGGGFFKKAVYTAQADELTYYDEEFVYYGRLVNSQLPDLWLAVNSWMGNMKKYRLSYNYLNQDERAAFDYNLPTALCWLQTMKIEQLSKPYAGEWDYGVLYIFDGEGNTVLWQLILAV